MSAPRREAPAQVRLVLLGQGRDAHRDAGQVETLVVRDLSTDLDPGHDVRSIDGGDPQSDLAVVHEDRVAGPAVPRQTLVGRGHEVLVAGHVLDGDREDVPLDQRHRAGGEGTQPDLRALQVNEHADSAPRVQTGLADLAVPLFMFGVGAMAEVQTGDVHPGLDELAKLSGDGWAQCADNLGATHLLNSGPVVAGGCTARTPPGRWVEHCRSPSTTPPTARENSSNLRPSADARSAG